MWAVLLSHYAGAGLLRAAVIQTSAWSPSRPTGSDAGRLSRSFRALTASFLHSVAIGWLFVMAMWGTIGFIVTVIEYVQEWLHAHRNINKEVPTLADAVEELRKSQLRKSQSRLEVELEQILRPRPRASARGNYEMPPRD